MRDAGQLARDQRLLQQLLGLVVGQHLPHPPGVVLTATNALALTSASSPPSPTTMPAFSVPIPSTTTWGPARGTGRRLRHRARAVRPRPAEPAGQEAVFLARSGRTAGGQGRVRAVCNALI